MEYIAQWPWYWAKLLEHIKWVESVATRAGGKKERFPPRHLLWDREYINEKWFAKRK